MNQTLFAMALALIFIGLFLLIVSTLLSVKEGEVKTKVGIAGFIGFVPFGFGTDRQVLYVAITLAITALVVFLVLSKILFKL